MDPTAVEQEESDDQPQVVLGEDGTGLTINEDSATLAHVTMGVDENGAIVTDGQALITTSNEPGVLSWAQATGGGITIVSPEQAAFSLQSQPQVVLAGGDQLTAQQDVNTITDVNSLQNLLAGGNAQLLMQNGETIQVITIPNSQLRAVNNTGQLIQLVPSVGGTGDMGTILINQPEGATETQDSTTVEGVDGVEALENATTQANSTQVVDMVPVTSLAEGGVSLTSILMPPPPPPPQNLPPGCPTWAARLRDCEKIGDSYRGWVDSEVELDLLLTYHKQQTQSFWGTRQSPSPAKTSTRLMWKSQYVPFDGIPFVNSGSRAIVMECQFGPRRKGAQAKKQGQSNVAKYEFKQTCPARIYIKKVKKFHECSVDVNLDKKQLKQAMDQAFAMLKERSLDAAGLGQERFYVQLPTESSHEYHNEMVAELEALEQNNQELPAPSVIAASRLHPKVATKVRELVAGGERRLYAIRKFLRRFVEKELFENSEAAPERHNLSYFPTVNDLQNHIHQALKDIERGVLQVTAPVPTVLEVVTGGQYGAQNTDGSPHAETVTVTLTQNPGEDGPHVISRVETQLSDGTTQISNSLTPETAQLLSKLHPGMFPAGSLVQLQGPTSTAGAIPITIQTTTTTAQPVMVDAATGESGATDINMGATSSEADLSAEGDVSLLPNLHIDQSDQAQLPSDEMQMLTSADLTADQLGAEGIGVQIGPDGSVQYVQQSILDSAQALQIVQHDGVQMVTMAAAVDNDNMLPVTVDEDSQPLMKQEDDEEETDLLDMGGQLSVDEEARIA